MYHISGLYSLKTVADKPLSPQQIYLAPLPGARKYSSGGMSYCARIVGCQAQVPRYDLLMKKYLSQWEENATD